MSNERRRVEIYIQEDLDYHNARGSWQYSSMKAGLSALGLKAGSIIT